MMGRKSMRNKNKDADITIEKTGVLRLSNGFQIKEGARFIVR